MPIARSDRLRRLGAAAPDAVTALGFLVLWLLPLAFGPTAVGNAVTVIGIEFIFVHAGGFLGMVVFGAASARLARLLWLGVFGAGYLALLTVIVYRTGQWWPVPVFAWLLLGKFALVVGHPSLEQRRRAISGWVLATFAYVLGAVATAFLPLPSLSLDADTVSQLSLSGGGLWIEQPHRAMAFGTLYFGVLAWSKWRDWLLPVGQPGQSRRGRRRR